MSWIGESWTWKSVPFSFVSSELCFLPHLLNINDTQNKARKAGGERGSRDVISGCQGADAGAWTRALPEKKVHFKLRTEFITLTCYLNLPLKGVILYGRDFSISTLEFTNLNKASPLKSLCPAHCHCHCHFSPCIWNFSLGSPLIWVIQDFLLNLKWQWHLQVESLPSSYQTFLLMTWNWF